MATISTKSIIDKLIENDGHYEGDPRAYMIVEYTNSYGNQTWGVTWPNDRNPDKYLVETEFVRNPQIIWRAK